MTITQQTAWPEGVIARYLTAAGQALADPTITVDVTKDEMNTTYTCRGCQGTHSGFWEPSMQGFAQKHATECSALPRPTV